MREMVIFLAEAGQLPTVWQPQVEALPPDLPMASPWLDGLRPGQQRSFASASAAQALSDLLTEQGIDRGYVVAHGFSTLVASLAASQDDRIAGLILIAPRVPPTKRQTRGLKLMSRFLPGGGAFDQGDLARALDALAEFDLPDVLGRIFAPTALIGIDRDQASQDGVGTYLKHLRVATGASVPAKPAHDGIPSAVTPIISDMINTWRAPTSQD